MYMYWINNLKPALRLKAIDCIDNNDMHCYYCYVTVIAFVIDFMKSLIYIIPNVMCITSDW